MDNRDERSAQDLLDESLGLHVELRPGKHLHQSEEPPAVEEADYPHFRKLTFFSVLAGLCPLIPVPFVDDWALGLIQRRMVRDLGENRRLGLREDEVQVLAGKGEQRPWPGVLKGSALLLRRGARKLVGKLFKTAFYALLLRDGIHRAVETFVQGYLLLYATRIPHGLRLAGRTPERVRAVRAAVVATLQEADVTPIHKAMARSFRRSFDLLSKAASLLGTVLGRTRSGASKGDTVPLQEEEELLGGFVDNLAATLWGDQEYFEGLERAFDERFARQQPGDRMAP